MRCDTPAAPRRTSLSARVLKVMGLFSGVQALTIICSIVRTKLVAIWLGPAGIGLFGLYNSVMETICSVTQAGTGTGVIRELAMAPRETLPRLVAVVRRWGWALGLAGALLTLALSPALSRFTFGDDNHTGGFIALSAAVLLLTLSSTEGAIFQGLKRYTRLAKSTVWGAVGGLAVSAPMYYYWGLDSVIPSLLAYAAAIWICRGLYHEKTPSPGSPLGMKETFSAGKGFAMLGIYMTVTTFATNAVSYIFMSYLNQRGGVEAAGFYQAGFTLVNRYVGLVLVAVGMEYLPRLSEVSRSPRRTELFLSHEIILIMLVMFPVVTIFVAADELFVRLLYDKAFLVMLPFVTWAVIGTIFRAWSWCLAYVILAKSDGVVYLLTELLSAIVAIGLNILFYDRWGIRGLGYAYTLWYLFYLAEVWLLCRSRYRLRIRRNAIWLPAMLFLACAGAALCRELVGWWGALPFVILSLAVSASGLRRLLGVGPARIIEKFVKPAKKG